MMTLDVFIRQENISLYKKLLADHNISNGQRDLIGKMLAEEEAKLLDLFSPQGRETAKGLNLSPSVQPENPAWYLHRSGAPLRLKIGKALGVGTGTVQRVVMEQPRPFDVGVAEAAYASQWRSAPARRAVVPFREANKKCFSLAEATLVDAMRFVK